MPMPPSALLPSARPGRPPTPRRRLWLVGLLLGLFLVSAAAVAAPAAATSSPAPAPGLPEPIEVDPGWNDLPGKEKILDLLDTASQLALACCIASAIIGGASLGLGRLTGSGASGARGAAMVLGGGGGAVIVEFAPDLIAWLAS